MPPVQDLMDPTSLMGILKRRAFPAASPEHEVMIC